MPGKERLVTSQVPATPGPATGVELDDFVDQQERRAMRKHVSRPKHAERLPGGVGARTRARSIGTGPRRVGGPRQVSVSVNVSLGTPVKF